MEQCHDYHHNLYAASYCGEQIEVKLSLYRPGEALRALEG